MRTSTEDGRVLVKVEGALDASSRYEVEGALYELAETADATIDLAEATFVDLGSVRMLVDCRQRADASGHDLTIVNGPSHVERMLEMLERGHYWRPEQHARHPLTTTTDEQRSRPDSEQIVRLQCESCGYMTFRPEGSAEGACPVCKGAMETVAVFRDRRRVDAPVDVDRRSDRN
ncbi:MAG: hypothetical protein QOJ29_2318 [Thermoleophilaceae bacterium]|jgi:anti-anti-sigma factor|nr:hypothetical protein [Thermoleophilaceae bacterium]